MACTVRAVTDETRDRLFYPARADDVERRTTTSGINAIDRGRRQLATAPLCTNRARAHHLLLFDEERLCEGTELIGALLALGHVAGVAGQRLPEHLDLPRTSGLLTLRLLVLCLEPLELLWQLRQRELHTLQALVKARHPLFDSCETLLHLSLEGIALLLRLDDLTMGLPRI